ncbi:pyrroline-5-carboxylate reductase [Bacillus sp. DTU_2020_1000418_1_SI_GHA_SEK_038]|uniref:pyrroline-5-carboxylate reductase n=1 Tax=Bacillus sp. DTU_2020_1000418_1_SI_GHA_SEK_038 TaxID=3077585 RepID=UPI0028F11ED8|nr:pyrroline-5-carboxylate reductase [Bacillus sp. DTU_2020_1000418_1_SI_GHA_SEK_038]WNS74137.1 pyrroline-5-carboxylate reductase [Bacillus sp. DTU_2020_1000418_1_SI_GHA_SEK_038]
MKKIAFIGAGSMAEALISGIVENKLIDRKRIWVTNKADQEKLTELQNHYGVQTTYNLKEIFQDTDIVFLAMKPKDAAEAISRIKDYLTEEILVISVLAGVSIRSVEKLIGKPLAIVRAMPNTSAAVGKSATALAINEKVSNEQMTLVAKMFETVGLTTIVQEEQLDAVTGLSGSGPAYIYYLAEAMEKSAMDIGLEKTVAKELIVQTLLGAAEMLSKSAKEPQQLRKEVTSPGGTTEAGIKILDSYSVQKAFIDCIKEATAQSKRLGKAFGSEISV